MLAGGRGAEHSPTRGHAIMTGAGRAGLTIRLPLDALGELLSLEHTGYSKGGLSPWQPGHLQPSLTFPDHGTLASPSPRRPLNTHQDGWWAWQCPPPWEGNPSIGSGWTQPSLKLFLPLPLPTHTWAEPGARVRQCARGKRALLLLTGDLTGLGGTLAEGPRGPGQMWGVRGWDRLPGRSSGGSAYSRGV